MIRNFRSIFVLCACGLTSITSNQHTRAQGDSSPQTGVLPDGTKWIHIPGVQGENVPEMYVSDEFIAVLKPDVADRVRISRAQGRRTGSGVRGIDNLIAATAVRDLERQFPTAQRPAADSDLQDLTRYYRIKLDPGAKLDDALAAFSRDPGVDHVERIGIHPVYGCGEGNPRPANDFFYLTPPEDYPFPQWDLWGEHGIDAESAWSFEVGDPDVVVVAMDTGMRYNHADLCGIDAPSPTDASTNGNVWVNPFEIPGNGIDDEENGYIDDVVGYDFVDDVDFCAVGEDCSTRDNDPRDFNGHGTHTAGTMAAITNNAHGVAGIAGGFGDGSPESAGNGVKVMGLRIGWQDANGGGFVRMDFAAAAMHYIADMKKRGVNIAAVNCSWGSSGGAGFDAAVGHALAADILVVHAAGNSNVGFPDFLGSRAGVLDVAATNPDGSKAGFSNYGGWVEVAAPGVAIISTFHWSKDPDNDYVAVLNGTSMAAPHVAGVAALLRSCNPNLTRVQIFQILATSVCPAESPGIGGILNAQLALEAAGCAVPSTGACCGSEFPFDCEPGRTPGQCRVSQGAYAGNDTTCDTVDCNRCGAETCQFCWIGTSKENDCEPDLEGDGPCDCGCQFEDIDCLFAGFGACCRPESPHDCTDGVARYLCLREGGAYAGNGTVCASADCNFCDTDNCERCWTGTTDEARCPLRLNGDGPCDCGCQFTDVDCGCGDGFCLYGECACTCPADCSPYCGDECCSHDEKNRDCSSDCFDMRDMARFSRCYKGAGVPRSFSCQSADFDDDGDVDGDDFALFRADRFGGP